MENMTIPDSWFESQEEYEKEMREFEETRRLSNQAFQGHLWCVILDSKYSKPELRKVNYFDEDKVYITEFFGGAQCSGTIARSKIIMFGTRKELVEKFNAYLEIHELVENVRKQYEN